MLRSLPMPGFRRLALCLLAASLSSGLCAENLIFNSGFELGDAGFECTKYLDIASHPDAKYIGPQQDSSTSASGRNSLRIVTPFGEKTMLAAREFKLKPGVEYTFSCSMKSDMENLRVGALILSVSSTAGWNNYATDFTPGKDWKRFSFTFKTKTPWAHDFFTLFLSFGKEAGTSGKAGSLWLDNLQIDEGPEKPYAPGHDVEVATVSAKSYCIIGKEAATAKAELRAVNYGKTELKAPVLLDVVDEQSGKSMFNRTFDLSLKSNEPVVIPCEIPLDHFSTFALNSSIKGASSYEDFPGYFAVGGDYERKPLDMKKDFCLGFNYGGGGFKRDIGWGGGGRVVSFECSGMGPDEYYEMLAKMGCRSVRYFESWRTEEPEEGKFDFSQTDYITKLMNKHGIYSMPVLGSADFLVRKQPNPDMGWPKWVEAKSKFVEKSGDWRMDVKYPPLDAWTKYVRAFATHFKGRIACYEIVNEPNGYLSPEGYMPYLKAAYEQIKAVDPKAIVVGFSATDDLGGSLNKFLADSAKLGAFKYADAASFHPYGSVSLGYQVPADKVIEAIKAMLKQHGGPGSRIQLWNTELFCIGNGSVIPPGGSYYDTERHAPYHLACRALTDLGEGVAQSNFLEQYETHRKRYSPHFEGNVVLVGEPGADLVACNAITRHFEGAKPVAKLKWGSDSVCYVYERNGRRIAAFWNYGSTKGIKAKLAATDANVQLYDLFGNKLALGGEPLALGPSPFYIKPKDGFSNDAFTTMLKSAKVEAENPVIAGTARLLPEGNGWTAIVPLSNSNGEELKGKLGVQGKSLAGNGIADIAISGGEEKAFPVPVKLDGQAPSEIVVKLQANGRIFNLPAKLVAPAKVYAVSSKVGAVQTLKSGNASFSASTDGKALRLSFDVKDAQPSGAANGRDPWNQDCIELFIDAAPQSIPTSKPEAYTGKVARLFILPYEPEGKRLAIWPGELGKLTTQNISLNLKRSAEGYSATLSIPLEALELSAPLKGKCLGFEAAVDYADATERQKTESWTSSDDAYKNRLSFGILSFE